MVDLTALPQRGPWAENTCIFWPRLLAISLREPSHVWIQMDSSAAACRAAADDYCIRGGIQIPDIAAEEWHFHSHNNKIAFQVERASHKTKTVKQSGGRQGIRSCKTSTNTVCLSIGHPDYVQHLRTHPLFDECVNRINLAGGHAERKKEGKNERKGNVSIQHRVRVRVRVFLSLTSGESVQQGVKSSQRTKQHPPHLPHISSPCSIISYHPCSLPIISSHSPIILQSR